MIKFNMEIGITEKYGIEINSSSFHYHNDANVQSYLEDNIELGNALYEIEQVIEKHKEILFKAKEAELDKSVLDIGLTKFQRDTLSRITVYGNSTKDIVKDNCVDNVLYAIEVLLMNSVIKKDICNGQVKYKLTELGERYNEKFNKED